MQSDTLTTNGIQKLISGVNNVVVQCLGVNRKLRNKQEFYGAQLSDGYCKLKNCLIVDQTIFTNNKLMQEHLVVRIVRSMAQQNKSKENIIIVQHYQVVTDKVKNTIGEPMHYEQYLKKGKKNPKGNNSFKIGSSEDKYADLMEDTKQEEPAIEKGTYNNSRSIKKTQKFQSTTTYKQVQSTIQVSKGGLRLSNEEENKTNNTTRNNSLLNRKKQTNQNSNNVSHNASKQQKNKLKPGPIQKIEQRRSSPNVKGNQSRPNTQYNQLKTLFPGMEHFVILVRAILVTPLKNFINKKGVDSVRMNVQFGDKSGVMESTLFGEAAHKFENSFKEGQVYQIANAQVQENTYQGKHSLALRINESTRVSLMEDDPNVPLMEDFCITVHQLINTPIGQTVKVICLIKDNKQTQQFVTKAGKDFKKRMIQLCDPINKVEVETSLLGDNCDTTFQKQPYMVHCLQVQQYNGVRQYNLGLNRAFRVLKHHPLRRYIKQLDNMQLTNANSDQKHKSHISCLKDISNLMQQVNDKGTWSQLMCSISGISMNKPPFYVACPHCNKKVQEARDGQCQHCSKNYEQGNYKYMMRISVCDYTDSVFVTAFKEAEKVVGMPASEFVKLSEEQVQGLVKELRGKEMKLKMVTKHEQYNGQVNKKTNLINTVPINYAEETKHMLTRLKQALK